MTIRHMPGEPYALSLVHAAETPLVSGGEIYSWAAISFRTLRNQMSGGVEPNSRCQRD